MLGAAASAAPGNSRRALVVVFLRGGADGLTLVPPVGDDAYHRARPTLAIPAASAIPLAGIHALHPSLTPLARHWHDGRLAVVHAAGCDDDTRSHFYAQDLVDRAGRAVSGGWLARLLRARGRTPGALGAVAIGDHVPESLRGSAAALVRDAAAVVPPAGWRELAAPLLALHAEDPLLDGPARATVAALERLEALRGATYRPEHGADYPTGDFASGLAAVAQLIKAGVGLEVATLDLGGWDSHIAQQLALDEPLRALGAGLGAFADDLGPQLDEVSVVVLSEFGRRVAENGALGTDHGRGGAMFVLGGGTPGGLHGSWPGLGDGDLLGPGDLDVTTDYRSVLAAVLARHGLGASLTEILPGFAGAPIPV